MKSTLLSLILLLCILLSACASAPAEPDSSHGSSTPSSTSAEAGESAAPSAPSEIADGTLCAAAYLSILEDVVNQYGICTDAEDAPGLTYASLTDFDGDGTKELYLCYAAGEGTDGVWEIQEQLWRWDGSRANCLLDFTHQNDGTALGKRSSGRWMLQDGEETLLVSLDAALRGGIAGLSLKVLRLQDEKLVTAIDAAESYSSGTAAGEAGSDYTGYLIQTGPDGQESRRDLTEDDVVFQASDDFPELPVVTDGTDGQDSPGSLYRDYASRLQASGTQIITSETYSPLSWACSDVAHLIQQLQQAAGR